MRIALFDYVVAPHSGPGGCDAWVLDALRGEHELTVFASELVLPNGGGRPVRHVVVRTVRHPALAAFLLYFVRAWLSYGRFRRRGARFDLVQSTDCSFPAGDVFYAHLCHRAFLHEVWPHVRGHLTARKLHSWISHKVRALLETRLVRKARVIVVPSEGLKRDFLRTYPGVSEKVKVIPNTVDLAGFRPPPGFDRRAIRERMDSDEVDTVFVFVALGHFERKGLPMLLQAISADRAELDRARLWVVGGEPGLVAAYRETAERLGVGANVRFAGRTDDVRPFLWSADAFIAPSHYEAFSLALLEAAAAELPLLATRISGSEELLEDGVNGFEIAPSPAGVSAALRQFLALDASGRQAMRHAARASVEPLAPERFAAAWRELYASLEVGQR